MESAPLPPQNKENGKLKALLKANVEKPVKLEVFSTKTMKVREVEVVPSNMWGGQGLLGASVRFCSFRRASEHVWHVLVSGHRAWGAWVSGRQPVLLLEGSPRSGPVTGTVRPLVSRVALGTLFPQTLLSSCERWAPPPGVQEWCPARRLSLPVLRVAPLVPLGCLPGRAPGHTFGPGGWVFSSLSDRAVTGVAASVCAGAHATCVFTSGAYIPEGSRLQPVGRGGAPDRPWAAGVSSPSAAY